MKIYAHRFDEKFQNKLANELSIENLKVSSFEVAKPREREDQKFNKCCRIDYLGLSGSILFDIACNFISDDIVPRQVTNLFDRSSELNDLGIFIKLRLLLMYPFSTSFFSLIQAESSIHRSSVESPNFLRDFSIVDQVDEATFYSSASIRNQKSCLKYIQELISKNGWDEKDSPNTVRVRFTPIDGNVTTIIVNDSLFYAPYLFAKTKRQQEYLALRSPVVNVHKNEEEETFNHFEDHFRYLWDLDTTIYQNDATAYDPEVPGSLSRIRPPAQISYDDKAQKIFEKMEEQSSVKKKENNHQGWKLSLKYMLQRLSSDTRPSPKIESIFVACSWDVGDDGKSRPNDYAKLLSNWLEHDFGNKQDIPQLSIHVLEAATGVSLAEQVYARLREATLAIVILSKDIKTEQGEFYTKPNVIHELGYLMSRLDDGRLIVLRENPVIVPSNINDNVYIEFQSNKLDLCYREIVMWLKERSAISDNEYLKESLHKHHDRLDEAIIDGRLIKREADEGKRKIRDALNKKF